MSQLNLEGWIEKDKRVLYELETLLKALDVPIGKINVLRKTVDSFAVENIFNTLYKEDEFDD